jgi:predicted enzyme related to lactoylglutathione lyase
LTQRYFHEFDFDHYWYFRKSLYKWKIIFVPNETKNICDLFSRERARGCYEFEEWRRIELKIKVTSIWVDDQEKALRFYTDVMGFAKKADFSQGPYRWLTVASPEQSDGVELQLALNNNPAGKAYQQAIFQQNQPAIMFFTDDIKSDYEKIKGRGAEFTMPPTAVTGSTIAMLKDTCGNLVQLTQLAHY